MLPGGFEPAKEREMLHTVMIVLHATAGVVAFAAGSFALFPPRAEQRATQLFWVYLVSLGLLVVFLVGAMAAHWQELGTTERVIFSALLAVLGVVAGNRALHWAEGTAQATG